MNSNRIHHTAIVETQNIGSGTRVWAFTHIMAGAVIGKKCNVGEHCFVESGACIGDGVIIKNGNMIWDKVIIEDDVFIGPNVHMTNDLYPRSRNLEEAKWRYERKEKWIEKTVVKKGATLGAASVILAGITIKEYAMIGAGSIVTKNVLSHSLVIGNPAKKCGWVCRCGNPLIFNKERTICSTCGLSFEKDTNDIVYLIKDKD